MLKTGAPYRVTARSDRGIRPADRRTTNVAICTALAFVVLAGTPVLSYAQTYGTANHRVTVTVNAITVLQLSSGIINLAISGSNAIAGQDQMTVTDQSSTLSWGTNSSLRKVTVNSNVAAPKFTLKVVAVNPTSGNATSEVTLTTSAADFILNIARSSGTCGLLYTGIALASQGTGTDSHTITYTVAAQ